MKSDLHMHGLIGLQPQWQKIQGYQGKNLTKEIVNEALKKDIDLVAITSEEFEIPKWSAHDRFGYLLDRARILPRSEYCHDKLGDDYIVFAVQKKGEQPVYIINSQTVIVNENGKRLDHLVIGSNQIPNQKDLQDTINYCNDRGLIQIAEHIFCERHFGLGRELTEKYLQNYDAIEGHNSQMRLPEFLSFLPKIGKYNQGVNKRAQQFATTNNKPWIATSDAHQISDLGVSYIDFSRDSLNLENENKFLSSLKEIIKSGRFFINDEYSSLPSWFKWIAQFQYGLKKYRRELVSDKTN